MCAGGYPLFLSFAPRVMYIYLYSSKFLLIFATVGTTRTYTLHIRRSLFTLLETIHTTQRHELTTVCSFVPRAPSEERRLPNSKLHGGKKEGLQHFSKIIIIINQCGGWSCRPHPLRGHGVEMRDGAHHCLMLYFCFALLPALLTPNEPCIAAVHAALPCLKPNVMPTPIYTL